MCVCFLFYLLQKIKEITYMHSEGILAGELKHGPLALVDKLMPVIMIIMRDHTYTKCQNALQQVVARQVRAVTVKCFRSHVCDSLLDVPDKMCLDVLVLRKRDIN